MRARLPISVVTCLAFAWAVLWPEVARARDATPPPAAAPAAPAAQPATDAAMAAAKQHFEAGRAAYNAGDYPNAIREFKAAEALRPSPVLAYNIGLANEKLARRRVAVRYYRRYLEGAPAASNRAEVEGRIAALEKEIAAQPQAQPPEQPQDNPPPPPSTTPEPNASAQAGTVQPGQADPYGNPPPIVTPPAQRKRNLWWVWLLVGIGSALVITAIVLGAYYGTRAPDYYIYEGRVDLSRLPAADRAGILARDLVPPAQRASEIAPLVTIPF
jgi:tetratricopeptide (TPR) repeat protein